MFIFDNKKKALKKNKSYLNNRYLDIQLSKGENAKMTGFYI